MSDGFQIKVEKTAQSNLSKIDFSNLPFGKFYADHMFVCDFQDGVWKDARIVPFQNLSLSPASLCLHYGQLIFEGLKAYRNVDGEIVLFRPAQHLERINKSADRLCMAQLTDEVFMGGLLELLKIDSEWVPKDPDSSLYIRPFMIATDVGIGVTPSLTYQFIILTSPVSKYYSAPVKVVFEDHFSRAAEGGIGFSKTAGNYAASLYPTKKAVEKGYNQLIWTDSKEHKYIEESGTMNIMFVINDTLITPALHDSILSGITRDSILTLAKDWGYKVEERKISVDEIVEALKNNKVQDAFGTGTAAVVAHFALIGHAGVDYELPPIESRTFSNKMKQTLLDIRLGKVEDEHKWVYVVK
ncbi:MAG: hypothetical protein RIQ70_1456 [Bacteroidota bacterium]|jgi:branched-chain amino acid aminotransferase